MLFGNDLIIGGGSSKFGTAPVSVANFAGLAALSGCPDGYTVTVTAESGLSADTLVRWDESGGVWLLLSTSCAYSVMSDVQWGATPGRWHSSGGVAVDTAEGATVTDTTNRRARRWVVASTQFVPQQVYQGTIANVQKIKGDDAAPSGWTYTHTDGGGTASITTDGTKLTLSASTSGAGNTTAALFHTDAALLTGTNFYVTCIMQVTGMSGPNEGQLFRLTVQDGTRAFDFGSGRAGGVATTTGAFFHAASGNLRYAAQAGNDLDITAAEVLVEVIKFGDRCSVRVGASELNAINGASVRSSASTNVALVVAADRLTGTATASVAIRNLCSMRF